MWVVVLWDLWAYVQKHGHKDKPITIVLDEMQNLDHRPDSPIDKFLREGRKFGISLILATQTISNFNQEQKDRLFQASTKLFFKPATTEVDSFAVLLSKVYPGLSKAEWVEHLNSLNKGQCFFIGYIDDGHGGADGTALASVDIGHDPDLAAGKLGLIANGLDIPVIEFFSGLEKDSPRVILEKSRAADRQ